MYQWKRKGVQLVGLKRQIERLRHWACPQAYDCRDCKYAIHGDWNDHADEYDSWCPFDNVIRAAEYRAKEGKDNLKERDFWKEHYEELKERIDDAEVDKDGVKE